MLFVPVTRRSAFGPSLRALRTTSERQFLASWSCHLALDMKIS